jgi:long-chain fatty acid transport protein
MIRARTRSLKGALLGALAATTLSALAAPASAAGLFVTDRGVRPLGRGGAFVAGADDLGSIVYNPAGLYEAGMSVLLDASYIHFTSDYTRRATVTQVDPNTGQETGRYPVTYPTVQGSAPFLPIPTLAFSFVPHPQWVVGLGVWAPYAGLAGYAETVNGKPAPQRYSLLSLDGSVLAVGGAYAAYAPTPNLRIGAGVEVMGGKFQSTVVMSGCVPDKFFCAPEQPEWDVKAQLAASPIISPSGTLGIIFAPTPKWRVGLSGHLPFWVRAPATIKTRLPSTPVFEKASQEGESARVSFNLPWTLRLGVEARPIERLRVEVAGAIEGWGMHDQITADPQGIALVNVAGFPPKYYLPNVVLPRNFTNAFSARLGGEYGIPIKENRLDVRAGVMVESSAVPKEYLSVLTIDTTKVTAALGASFTVGKLRFDVTYAHVFMTDTDVSPDQAKLAQVSPVQANPPARPDIINGGLYQARADVVGLGVVYTFGKAKVAEQKPAETKPAEATTAKR